MGRDELLVGVERVRLRGLLPVPVFGELLDALLGRYAVLAVRMLAQEILVGLGRVAAWAAFQSSPTWLHPATPNVTAVSNANNTI